MLSSTAGDHSTAHKPITLFTQLEKDKWIISSPYFLCILAVLDVQIRRRKRGKLKLASIHHDTSYMTANSIFAQPRKKHNALELILPEDCHCAIKKHGRYIIATQYPVYHSKYIFMLKTDIIYHYTKKSQRSMLSLQKKLQQCRTKR